MASPRQPWLHELVTAVQAPTILLCDRDGQLRPNGAQGVWHADVRVLSQAELRVDGELPDSVAGGPDGAGQVRFTGFVRSLEGDGQDPSVRLERVRTVRAGIVDEAIVLTSYIGIPTTATIEVLLATDFARIGPVKAGLEPEQSAVRPEVEPARVRWAGPAARAEIVTDDGATVTVDGDTARLAWTVNLAQPAAHLVRWRLHATVGATPMAGADSPDAWPTPRVTAGDHRLPGLVDQSVADLSGLRMRLADRSDVFLGAGAPWYLTLFGRDSIWAARMLLPLGTEIAAGTLRTLAALQGTRVDPETGEAPGKIPHELRESTPGESPAGLPPLYYGSVDATPLWICLLHDAWRWGMPPEQVQELLPNLEAALAWLVEHGDPDRDGFLEYVDDSGKGLANQGWKDSGDAIRFADGRQAEAPVALCEVQGYAYEAAMHGAALLDAFGRPDAGRWRTWAGELAERFRERFWVPGSRELGPYPALALDADKKPVDSLTSNIGHLLGTGLLSSGESERVVRLVTRPELASGFGLRTMSDQDTAYSPVSYHCGSVWPHDTAIVIRGLAAAGRGHRAAELIDGLLAAAVHFDFRLPELYGGDPRVDVPRPVPYPAACRPQAWSAASAMAILQALLGLEADVPSGRLKVRPIRPSLVGRLQVEGLIAAGHEFTVQIGEDGRARVLTEDIPLKVDAS
ncbi:MAG TPA: glycogen debranching N-terminal domain-containing protein [Nocardioidaceae bacterium]|nr:glycogen debranching N-terminal domain-containing protein [Nocardioidaceae bacterium]